MIGTNESTPSTTENDAKREKPIRISLVVPLRNEEASVETLIESIKKQSLQPEEIILVDGGSDDRTIDVVNQLAARDTRFRIVLAGNATPGRGRNVGVAAAVNDWIAFTDAGITLDPTWLAALAEVVDRDPDIRVVYGNCEPKTNTFFTRCAKLAYAPLRTRHDGMLIRGPVIASSLLSKDVFRHVGGFPDLRASEDLIFIEKVRQAGFKTGWAPDAIVWWSLQPTIPLTFKRFQLYSRHNVLAKRERYWHYAVARNYLAAVPFIAMAAAHNAWWLTVPLAAAVARVAKSIWSRREQQRIPALLNPIQFLAVGMILLAIDVATFVGWFEGLRERSRKTAVKERRVLPVEAEE